MENEEWNSQNRIAIDEYHSIVKSFYENVLRPFVQRGERMDRDALEMIADELQWMTKEETFAGLPAKIQNAYNCLGKLADTLKKADDTIIAVQRDILNSHFLLGICCDVYGPLMKNIYFGRNPCREDQIKMFSTLAKARREPQGKSSSLIEASGQMFDVCKKCPYK